MGYYDYVILGLSWATMCSDPQLVSCGTVNQHQ